MTKQVAITLTRSLIGRPEGQRRTVAALGLHKINQTVTFKDSPSVRGMIRQIEHLVVVKDVQADQA
ncbi:50S ribosomal protein L30 [Alicyclobacillaceae bacterium I2511]|nr:50S ribosomal protein L30 [Alicyclobacillaceae bacterium I2511]